MVGLMLGCGLVTVKMTEVNLTNAVGIVFWQGMLPALLLVLQEVRYVPVKIIIPSYLV